MNREETFKRIKRVLVKQPMPMNRGLYHINREFEYIKQRRQFECPDKSISVRGFCEIEIYLTYDLETEKTVFKALLDFNTLFDIQRRPVYFFTDNFDAILFVVKELHSMYFNSVTIAEDIEAFMKVIETEYAYREHTR